MADKGYDDLCKLVVIGSGAVGKTNLSLRFTHNQFVLDTVSTQGIEFQEKTLVVEGRRIRIVIWDTGGQERYASVSQAFYRGAQGALLVFDITNHSSFDKLPTWLKELRNHAAKDAVIMLVGNKTDLRSERTVATDEALLFADEHDLAYIETSALDSTGVNTAFEQIVGEIHRRGLLSAEGRGYLGDRLMMAEGTDTARIDLHKPASSTSSKKSGGCC